MPSLSYNRNLCILEPNYFQAFNLIIAANVIETHMILLSTICNAYAIPLLIVRSCGLVGYCRVQVLKHEIIESRPDTDQTDLRLPKGRLDNSATEAHAFPALVEYCEKYALELCSPHTDTMEHAHIPYVVILYKANQLWHAKVQHTPTPTYTLKGHYSDLSYLSYNSTAPPLPSLTRTRRSTRG